MDNTNELKMTVYSKPKIEADEQTIVKKDEERLNGAAEILGNTTKENSPASLKALSGQVSSPNNATLSEETKNWSWLLQHLLILRNRL